MMQYSLATPPAAPLTMPTQVLSRHQGSRVADPRRIPWLARLLTFGGSLGLTATAGWQMYSLLPLNSETALAWGVTSPWIVTLLWLLLGLFIVTFGWVALTAMAALSGLLVRRNWRQAAPDAPLHGRTVLLMPVYNEDPVSVCAALSAMAEELAALGLARHFEIFVVSDTTDATIRSREAGVVQCLRDRLVTVMPVWYRRRDSNTARKAGNIRDFVSRWGSRYDYMVVLDADSLIAGDTLATLVREMDADRDTAILQTLPRLFNGETLYARLQQFSGVIYGPVFARGLSAWQGHDGNYWGHNAIIRVRAFAESAGLPKMPGPRPFGGEIRSHDFVEAALIRRAGWTVRMLPELPGSWEECPPTLLDAAVRDRRWAQGNVQHLGVVTARGLRWPSRAHMLMGVMNYVTSALWLALVVVGLALSTVLAPQFFTGSDDAAWLQSGQLLFNGERMIGLFLLTMTLLLLPKLLGIAGALFGRRRPGLVSRIRLLLGALVELLFSVLHAPIVMMLHSRHLWEIVRGQDSGWSAQQRRGRSIAWSELLRRHGGQTLLGLLMLGHLAWLASPLLYWMLPMIVGLVLALPLSALSGSRRAGGWLARLGLLSTPEELSQPAIIRRRRILSSQLETAVAVHDQAAGKSFPA